MCGRFNITDDPNVHNLLKQLGVDLGPLPVRYNLAPTDQVPVIHYWEGRRLISDMRWWLVPHWSSGPSNQYTMFNARCENLHTSRAFHGSFRHKRCIIPAKSYIEWQRREGEKIPYLFSIANQAIAFAGIWDYWSDGVEHVLSCSIVTTEAAPKYQRFHSRMPVMLDNEGAELWLDERRQPDDLYSLFAPELLFPLQATTLDLSINNARNKEAPSLTGNPVIIV
jgi:putative SOS response-associated peptidase YedK